MLLLGNDDWLVGPARPGSFLSHLQRLNLTSGQITKSQHTHAHTQSHKCVCVCQCVHKCQNCPNVFDFEHPKRISYSICKGSLPAELVRLYMNCVANVCVCGGVCACVCATPVDLPATFACRIAGPALHSSSNTIIKDDAARHTQLKRER